MHLAKIENPIVSIKALEYRVMEHVQCLRSGSRMWNFKELHWCPPPHECMKLNVEAATIAIIARNESGLITKSWAKSFNSCDPLMAEATAIL